MYQLGPWIRDLSGTQCFQAEHPFPSKVPCAVRPGGDRIDALWIYRDPSPLAPKRRREGAQSSPKGP